MTETLTKISQDMLLQKLGNDYSHGESVFALGGSALLQPSHCRLFFTTKNQLASFVEFPCTDRQLKPLLDACSNNHLRESVPRTLRPLHGRTRTISRYRPYSGDVLYMLPHTFSLRYGIVDDLLKLTIYTPHGRTYYETPHNNGDLLLIVCLPTTRCGGQLIVRHKNTTNSFDWSKDAEKIQWTAFRTECPYAIHPLTSGFGITLTYTLSLHHDIPTTSSLNLGHLSLYKTLNTAITCAGFMPDGGVLAFGLQHVYPLTPDHSKVEEFTTTFPKILQGCDRTLYAIATELGLNVEIHPIFDVEGEGDEMLTLVAEEFCPSAVWCMFDEEKWKYDIISECQHLL
ncbi:hypothetical protein BC938DRAFT_481363 [Jimgerdemannia flammicorona]|uniref:Uncharacterized protein n=1 Tax=Jimgerdemannia flammicorona TaxID=994334 RepID=A0A433QG96_9FUNG|nr:hypothetical protein BC938DRAFT_481363 [Jimgerdemannia flammicorona]